MVCLFKKILHYFKVYSLLIGIKINLEKCKVYFGVFFPNDIFWIEIVKTLSILDIFTDSTKNEIIHGDILFILYLS